MIIWLASYPRSGNTFLRALIYQVYGVCTYEFYERHRDPEVFEAINTVLGEAPMGLSVDEIRRAEDCYFVKTHEMPDEDSPAIYLVRDGRDALVSHAHFVQQYDLQLPPDAQDARYDDTLKMLIEGDTSFGGWSGNVRAWTTRSSSTSIIRFEDLVRTPLDCLRHTITAVGRSLPELPDPRIPTLENCIKSCPNFFANGRVGAWREEMRGDLHELFWKRHGDVMHTLGYSFR